MIYPKNDHQSLTNQKLFYLKHILKKLIEISKRYEDSYFLFTGGAGNVGANSYFPPQQNFGIQEQAAVVTDKQSTLQQPLGMVKV